MGYPPKDVEPSALFLKLKEAPAPSEVVDFPRVGADGEPIGQVRIQVLRTPQHQQASIRGQKWLETIIKQNKLEGQALPDTPIGEALGNRIAQEVLAMACVSVNPIPGTEDSDAPRYTREFRNADDLAPLTGDELTALFTAYSMVQQKFGPYPGNIQSEDELSAWVKRLTEGASELPLSLLNSHQLVELTMRLARRAYTLGATLESQCSTLPDTLASDLRKLGIGTSYYGRRHAGIMLPGSSAEDDDEPDDELPQLLGLTSDEDITIAEAAELAQKLTGGDASV
jgi:hypothetical protein